MTHPTSTAYNTDRPDIRRLSIPPCDPTYCREVYVAGCELRGIPYGFCWCGCRQKTTIPSDTDRSNWKIKGLPRLFLKGHATSLKGNPEYEERNCGFRSDCWIWMQGRGSVGRYGLQYGTARRPGEDIPISSQRLMYERHVGDVPEGYDIDHLCRITLCCNPDHLEAVTHEENVRRGKNTRLTPEGVRRMFVLRHEGWTFQQIADEYEICQAHAFKIIAGKKWKGVGASWK
jgi:hypothetical protein